MAQSTGAMSGVDITVEVTTDSTNWTDISGQATRVAVSGFARQAGENYTFDGDHAVVHGGKREPIEVEVTNVYTELAGEAFAVTWAEFDADDGDPFRVRWTPKTSGSVFTTTTGELIACSPPGGEAAPGDPLIFTFTVKCSSVDKS
jgi:hypothetical protein